MYERILIPTEGSARDAAALAFATHCCLVPGRRLKLEPTTSCRRIADLARDWSADLVVMPTHARSGSARFKLGSVSERVASDSGVPVLTMKAPHPGRLHHAMPPRLDRIVVPLDDDPTSLYVLPDVGRMARAQGARVLGVCVAEPLEMDVAGNFGAAARILDELGVRFDLGVAEGADPVATILDICDDPASDLVALTWRLYPGHETDPEWSIPEWVLHLSRIPTLLLPVHFAIDAEQQERCTTAS